MYMDSINATCHRYYFLALGIDNRCQPILPADINTREDDFFSRPEVTIYIYIYIALDNSMLGKNAPL